MAVTEVTYPFVWRCLRCGKKIAPNRALCDECSNIDDFLAKRFIMHHNKKAVLKIVKGIAARGNQVELNDGSVGIVAFVDANMRIARVKTEAGKNVTVKVINDSKRGNTQNSFAQ